MPQLEILSPGVYGFEKEPSRAPEGISPAKAGPICIRTAATRTMTVRVRGMVGFSKGRT